MIYPRQKTPALDLPLVGGGRFALDSGMGERGALLVFYRGLHCPVCHSYLRELDRLTPEFRSRGVNPVALSTDREDRAEQMVESIVAKNLPFAHSVPLGVARDWGLFISTSRGKTSIGIEEPPLFAEPGTFLLQSDQTLYFSAIQTMPFARPSFADFLKAIDFVVEKSYPARGEYQGDV